MHIIVYYNHILMFSSPLNGGVLKASLSPLLSRLLKVFCYFTYILAPCLHQAACPMLNNERDWCHTEVPISLDGPLAEIASAAGLRDRKLTFAYLVLSTANPSHSQPPDAWRMVSGLHATKGKVEAWLCGSGRLSRMMRLDRHCSDENEALDTLSRGALLSASGEEAKGRLRVGPEDRVQGLSEWAAENDAQAEAPPIKK